MRPYVDEECCIACGACEAVCPVKPNVFEIQDVSKVVHPEACGGAGECVEACPLQCIELKDD